jgi:hypothetical protein
MNTAVVHSFNAPSQVELLGSGFGSASLDQIKQALVEFFR